MKKLKGFIAGILMAAGLFTSLTGCGAAPASGETESESRAPESSAPESTVTSAPVTEEQPAEEENTLFDVADRTDLVGICYSTWFDPIIDANGKKDPPNISKVLAGEEEWGGLYAFHYWAEPALGYYRSTDTSVIRQHMTWLSDAGVDFIIIDDTNASTGWKTTPSAGSNDTYWNKMVSLPTKALLSTIREMRDEGLKTPYVAMWCATGSGWDVVDAMLEEFYSVEEFKDLFVYWDNLPFILTTSEVKKRDDIVWRHFWGLQGSLKKSEWSFLNVPSKVSYDKDGNAEQVGVCTAAQQTYMSDLSTARPRNGGKTFRAAWKVAFKARPKFVTITWWNEWAAQRFEDEKGNSRFVDNYNEEYSRDIEPMKGGHGDTYYQWMCQYIKAYKAHEECPNDLINE